MKIIYIKTNIMRLLLPFLALFIMTTLAAQGWEKNYGYIANDAKDVLETSDGGFATMGSLYPNKVLVKTDADGNLLWQSTLDSLSGAYTGGGLVELSDRGFAFAGVKTDWSIANHAWASLTRTDSLGNELWRKHLEIDFPVPYNLIGSQGTSVVIAEDGGLVFTSIIWGDGFEYSHIIKTDIDGNELWATTYEDTNKVYPHKIIKSMEGGFMVIGFRETDINFHEAYLLKLDEIGNIQWVNHYGTPANMLGLFHLVQDPDSNYVATGNLNGIGHLAKFSVTGDSLWLKTIPVGDFVQFTNLSNSFNGDGYVLIGTFSDQLNNFARPVILKTDKDGIEEWTKIFDLSNNALLYGVSTTSDSGYIVSGHYNNLIIPNAGGLYLIKTDSLGNVHSNQINGNVFHDAALDCNFDSIETRFKNWIVEAAGDQNYYGQTDSSGYYNIDVDTGTYTIIIHPSSPYWLSCTDSVSVNLSSYYDSLSLDFPMEAIVDCPYLIVDVSAPQIVFCNSQNYSVNYCNEGTGDAIGNYISVEIDSLFSVDSTSIPISTQVGNLYFFDIPDLAIQECGSFNIYTSLGCDSTLLGQTLCMEAHIYPDSLCLDSLWTGPIIEVSANCVGEDSIEFVISNVGGDVPFPFPFIIIEDNLLLTTGEHQLVSGADTSIIISTNPGSVYHLQAEQASGFPTILGNAYASATQVSCLPSMWLGSSNQFPEDDGQDYLSIDCQIVVGAWDPNDKQSFPAGRQEQHFIEANTDIEYHIRFQNTGSFYATDVLLVDTISNLLNLGTIQPGASSHPYEWKVMPDGTVLFIFENIMLPDSNTNEPESHGFVKFRISQQTDLVPGIVIYNKADIYFDNNEAVTTNETWLTIATPFNGIIDAVDLVSFSNAPQVKVYPNPFHDRATFEIIGASNPPFTFYLFDVAGKQVDAQHFQQRKYLFERKTLNPGIYFYHIEADGMRIGTGKIIIQ